MVIVVAAVSLFCPRDVAPEVLCRRERSRWRKSHMICRQHDQFATGEDGLAFFPSSSPSSMFVLFSNFFWAGAVVVHRHSQIAVTFALAPSLFSQW